MIAEKSLNIRRASSEMSSLGSGTLNCMILIGQSPSGVRLSPSINVLPIIITSPPKDNHLVD
jgi:hypothetical protein